MSSPAERVTLPILDAAAVTASWREALGAARAQVAKMERIPLEAVTAENILDQWDLDSMALEDVTGPISILNNVHPDRSVRDAADPV